MRVSTGLIFQTANEQVNKAREKEMAASERASSQKSVSKPSDDPSSFYFAENEKARLSSSETIERNGNFSQFILSSGENCLRSMQEILEQAHDLAIPASSDSIYNDQNVESIKIEAKALRDSFIRELNVKFNGMSLFGGFNSERPAFTETGEYQGNKGMKMVEVVKGEKVPVNLSAEKIIFGNGVESGVNILNVFDRFITGLETEQRDLIRTTLNDFSTAIEQVSIGITDIASRMNTISKGVEEFHKEQVYLKEHISELEEVDSVKAFTDLVQTQNVLKSALLTNQKIIADDSFHILFR